MCQKLGVQICTNTLDLTYSMTDFFPFFSAASHFLGDVHAPHSPPQHGRCPFWPLARAPKAAHRRRRRASGATTAPTRHFQPPARSLPPPPVVSTFLVRYPPPVSAVGESDRERSQCAQRRPRYAQADFVGNSSSPPTHPSTHPSTHPLTHPTTHPSTDSPSPVPPPPPPPRPLRWG